MPLLDKLRRPATSASNQHHRSNSNNDEVSQSIGDSPERQRRHRPIGSLQRLSLSLSRDGNTFGGFLTQEPEELEHKETPAGLSNSRYSFRRPRSPIKSTRTSRDLPAQSRDESNASPEKDSQQQQRFSLLQSRHASDPQLSTRYKADTESLPEETPTPKIIMTAPTSTRLEEPVKKKSKTILGRSLSPFRKSQMIKESDLADSGSLAKGLNIEGAAASAPDLSEHRIHFEDNVVKGGHLVLDPPAYGDESMSSLAIPISRLSESGGSDGSSGSHNVYARTTTTHTISTTTTFFKLKRKKKDKGPLFPLPERLPRPSTTRANTAHTFPRQSMSPTRQSAQAVHFESLNGDVLSPMPSPTHSMSALTNAPLGSPGPAIVRKHSTMSNHSAASSPSISLAVPPRLGARGRSSTMGSSGLSSDRGDLTPQPISARNSTSTSGRRSFGDLLIFSHKLRQNSGPLRHGTNNSPSTPGSKSNSIQLTRESEPEVVYPSRDDTDTPTTYLEKLEAAVSRGLLATILCKSDDEFSKTCLRKYMRGFSYFQESIDISIRKMLMEVELPKETQQIDRLLAGFADRYHECNPGIFTNADEAGIVAFSILLLHSDNHNKNNKRKMQKHDYVKNTQHGQVQVAPDILECFYDNICYTPFIHFEDDVAVHSHRLAAPKTKRTLMRAKSSESLRGPVDPYTLLLDNKLDLLRPSLKEVMDTEDVYNSNGTLVNGDPNDHHKAFVQSAVIQIVSARSRPDAFMTQATISNPAEAQAGLVSIKVAKVGLLWRKELKKKKAKRPWQEWGVVLTDSKLYFFRDVGLVKKMIAQYDAHVKSTNKNAPLIFKPPMSTFEPDASMAMDDAVVLMDTSYKKHKNAFTFIKHGGFEEVFLANSEHEMNDWIGKLNYAAAFRTAGVRMRGLLGTNYEGRRLLRKGSELSTQSNEAVTEHNTYSRNVDPQLAWEIMFYRHQLIKEKISGFDDKLLGVRAELDNLMRNARHLLLLLPIQAKTREALVLAAGRMSAKLKWTRVELWRTQTHAEILKKDLEAEGVRDFPSPHIKTSSITTPQKITPTRTGGQNLARADTEVSDLALAAASPTTSSYRRPSQAILEHIKVTEPSPEQIPFIRSPRVVPISAPDSPASKSDTRSDLHQLGRETSVIGSLVSRHGQLSEQDPNGPKIDDEEEDEYNALQYTGPPSADVDGLRDLKLRLPDQESESDKDRLSAISPQSEVSGLSFSKERGASVRRSLHRTLRDSSHGHAHHTSSHHRRKGKESGSSNAITEDGKASVTSSDSVELKRGTGSFILHGKKASVITMSPEWQRMTTEERLKSRQTGMAGAKRDVVDEEAIEDKPIDDNISESEQPNHSAISSPVREDFVSAASSRRVSMSTAAESGSQVDPLDH